MNNETAEVKKKKDLQIQGVRMNMMSPFLCVVDYQLYVNV